jgi:hypothetical protein
MKQLWRNEFHFSNSSKVYPLTIRSPDRPAHSQSLYRPSYRAHVYASSSFKYKQISKYLWPWFPGYWPSGLETLVSLESLTCRAVLVLGSLRCLDCCCSKSVCRIWFLLLILWPIAIVQLFRYFMASLTWFIQLLVKSRVGLQFVCRFC